MDLSFYHGKRVFVTGHTGFKGSWLCRILVLAGAEVTGYALDAPTNPSLFQLTKMDQQFRSILGDIRDEQKLEKAIAETEPEIVFHLAAQPIVRESYRHPAETFATNVMGTVYLCESIRKHPCVKSFVNVTTDKVYQNKEWEWGYRETDRINGQDPYSNSKSCSELVTASYRSSFLEMQKIAVSTARAGNVIGGGDFAPDRIIPDCIRAAVQKQSIIVRNPDSIRPYQHVLEPLSAYLTIAAAQYKDIKYAGSYNVGPDEKDCVTTGELTELFCRCWGEGQAWNCCTQEGPKEANFLKLDSSRIRARLGWKPHWSLLQAIEQTIAWAKEYLAGGNILAELDRQIQEYFN